MKSLSILLSFCLFSYHLSAQGGNKRFSFAKMYVGADFNYISNYGESQFLNSNNELETFTRNAYVNPSINIGATHFWGFADFYVSIPTTNIQTKANTVKTNTNFGVFTGLRIYPLQLTDYKLRPFVGYKFSPFRYAQANIDEISNKKTGIKSVLDAGFGYRLPNAYFYLGYNYIVNNDLSTYISRTDQINTTVPKHFFNLGVNFLFETTKMSDNSINRYLDEVLSTSNQDGLFFGIGPSAAFQIGSSSYLEEYYPFLDDKTMANTFVDLSIGYHFTKTDIVTSLAFRPITQKREAFNFSQKINRNSFTLEAYKVLGDYHGFSPYVGGGVSYERLRLREEDNGILITDLSDNKIAPVVTFGWDIRPSKKGDFWVLRTNLRYTPTLDFEHNNYAMDLDHLEFNFIQFVFYPQRFNVFKKYMNRK